MGVVLVSQGLLWADSQAMMETCRGMWFLTPTGEIWFQTGFWGPIVKEWPRDYTGKELR